MNKLKKGLLICGTILTVSFPTLVNAQEESIATNRFTQTIEQKQQLEKESKDIIGNRIYVDKPFYVLFKDISDVDRNFISTDRLTVGNYYTIVDSEIVNDKLFVKVSMNGKENALGWVLKSDFKYVSGDKLASIKKLDVNNSYYTITQDTTVYDKIPENVHTKQIPDSRIVKDTQINILEEFEKKTNKDFENWLYLDINKEFEDEKIANEFVKNSKFPVEKKEVENGEETKTVYTIRISGWVKQEDLQNIDLPITTDTENITNGKATIKKDSITLYDNTFKEAIFTLNGHKNTELPITSIKTEQLDNVKEKWFAIQKIDSSGNPIKDSKIEYIKDSNFKETTYTKIKESKDIDSLVIMRNDTIVYDNPVGTKGYSEIGKVNKDNYYYVKKQIIAENNNESSQWFAINDIDDNYIGIIKGDNIKYIKGDKLKHTVRKDETIEDVLKTYKITQEEFNIMNLDLVYLEDKEFKEGLEVVVKSPSVEYDKSNLSSGVTESGIKLVEDMMPTAPVITEHGIKPSIAYGQAILESGGGTSQLATQDNNLFGIKGTYKGQGSSWATKEDSGGGNMYTIDSTFRAYPNKMVSVFDYMDLITNSGIYDSAIGLETPEETITAIKNSGYATDSAYVSKVMHIVDMYDLTQFDKY